MNAFRVLTDPAETGAVTLCLPQDVQTECYDYPLDFFDKRVWTIERDEVNEQALARAIQLLKHSSHPLLIAGGGIHYSEATETLAEFAEKHKIPVAETQAGKSALPASHPMNVGGIGVTGSAAANLLAAEADVILVVGSRLQDFTTSSKWGFKNEHCQLINLNICRFDALKMNSVALRGDAKRGLAQLSLLLEDDQTSPEYQHQIQQYQEQWHQEVKHIFAQPELNAPGLRQTALLGILNEFTTAKDVIVGAAGSLPGDLHRLWRSKTPKDYHLEYAYSCMGYEVAAGVGVRLAKGESPGEVYVLVGDGSFIMLHSELLTAIQEHKKITVIIFDNHGYQCIRNLQEANGSRGFGNEFRYRDPKSNQLTGEYLSIDFCQYAAALGAKSFYANSYADFTEALTTAKEASTSCVIVLPVLPKTMSNGYQTWWRVGVAEISHSSEVTKAYKTMQAQLDTVREL